MYLKRLTKITIKSYYYKYGALFLLLIFSTVQYLLILRHKSPYLSDSYFYKHIFYQSKGDSYDLARQKVVSQVDLKGVDDITVNFFSNDEAYRNSLSFFTKRPLYPLLAAFVSLFASNEFLDFVIPVFVAYIASIILSFYIFRQGLSFFFAIFSTSLLISFYPFLDWSTYFLTDTIGFAFWLLLLFIIYKYIKKGESKLLIFFSGSLSISLLNREQSLFILPLLIILLSLMTLFRIRNKEIIRGIKLIIFTLIVVGIYFLISTVTKQRTLLGTINYTQNSYGLFQRDYTFFETVTYMSDAIKRSHIAFIEDLTRHHWWFVFFILGIFGIIKIFCFNSKRQLLDLLFFSSAIASYLSIFFYPVLSYRFFYPILTALLYFSSKLIRGYFIRIEKLL